MELRSDSVATAKEPAEPRKKKIRESKNRKKYWKKADIEDVEAFLEEKRFDERVGGDVSLRSDVEIYMLDKSADAIAERKFQKKRSDILKEPLKCTEVLRQRSKVPVPLRTCRGKPEDAKKSRVHLERERKTIQKRVEQSEKTLNERKSVRDERASRNNCRTLNSETQIYDIWHAPGSTRELEGTAARHRVDVLQEPADADFLADDQLAYFARVTRASRPKVPSLRYRKPSVLPAVEVAEPGASYKPTFEDHQALLSKANEVEVGKLKKEEHLERVLLSLFPTKERAKAIRVQNEVDEAAGILYSDDDTEDPSGDLADALITGNPPVRAENRKTRLQRNRQKAHREREALTAQRKSEKKIDSQFGRIGVYKKEIKKSNQATQLKVLRKKQKQIEAQSQPKKLGRQKFSAPDIEIKLTEELVPTLRQLKPEGSLMVDRMRSLEKRNLIEPRRKTIRKKKWTKTVYKRHYKKGNEDILTNPAADRLS
ncbi:ribosome biogenesis protein NOP53 [Galendromus occidentalis]|uniref:Ribosome biogenesis protein NOP53 n=1 Tax=Galendromus occidentalis TaxID=34638 RepID=A0AAJ6QJY5_9ACAR|nr:ribosome biogenesis protein NOP53 [Galendromus occidentalis]